MTSMNGWAPGRTHSGWKWVLLLVLGALLWSPLRSAQADSARAAGRTASAGAQGQPRGRVIVLGFDGMDPELARTWMAEGKLPNFARLAAQGTFLPLGTTTPAASPIAWSTFMTGANPGKTGLFDFTVTAPGSYATRPSFVQLTIQPPSRSARFWGPLAGVVGGLIVAGTIVWRPRPADRPGARRRLGLGALALVAGTSVGVAAGVRISDAEPTVTYAPVVHAAPFWKYLGEAGLRSVVLTVPMSFPAEPGANLHLLAGWPAPTAGYYYVYSRQPHDRGYRGVLEWVPWEVGPEGFSASGPGVDAPEGRYQGDRLWVRTHGTGQFLCRSRETEVNLSAGEWSSWVPYGMREGWWSRRRFLTRLCVLGEGRAASLLMFPFGYDFGSLPPGLPVCWPPAYGRELSQAVGPFPVGLDTAPALDIVTDKTIDDATFLALELDNFQVRWQVVQHELSRPDWDCLVAVWTETDHVQHALWRYLDPQHPAHPTEPSSAADGILQVYQQADRVVGTVMDRFLRPEDILVIVSDHGFHSFRRAVNLNNWLASVGYLTYRADADPQQPLEQRIDWEHTRASALGLTGIRLNQLGREPRGVVLAGPQSETLKRELTEKLYQLEDPASLPVVRPVSAVSPAEELYHGPWAGEAPDLVVSWKLGYRTNLQWLPGRSSTAVFADNRLRWSGDHVTTDPRLVPGVLFSSRPLSISRAGLEDIGPTVLAFLGVQVPAEMDGHALLTNDGASQ